MILKPCTDICDQIAHDSYLERIPGVLEISFLNILMIYTANNDIEIYTFEIKSK